MEQLSDRQLEALITGLEAELRFFRIASTVLLVVVLLLAGSLAAILGGSA